MKSVTQYHREFWTFSIDRYGRAGVPSICLELQDALAVDVNILLFCLWRGQERHAVDSGVINAMIVGEPGQWHRSVVLPLRAARTTMKGWCLAGDEEAVARLRDTVKSSELESERLEQLALVALLVSLHEGSTIAVDTVRQPQEIAMANAASYLEQIALEELASTRKSLSALVAACID